MRHYHPFVKQAIAAGTLLAGMLLASAAIAQPPDGGPPPGGPGGPGQGGPPPGGPGRRAPQPPLTALEIPASVLQSALSLTNDETSGIKTIQQNFRTQRDQLLSAGGGDGGQNGPPPGPPDKATADKIKSLHDSAEKSLEAVLTADQKTALAALVKEFAALRTVGLPPEAAATLNLTSDQVTQLAAIGKAGQQAMRKAEDAAMQSGDPASARPVIDGIRKDTHGKAIAVLTADQKAALKAFVQAHPRSQGGPGGPGGPPPGDGNGPPPGDGNGPPPGDGNGPPPPPPGDN